MKEKNWKEMDGWEKAWEVTKIAVGGAAAIGLWLLAQAAKVYPKGRSPGGGGSYGGGRSVWTVGSGGKKSGSWSSGRHR